jgi:hypothetical protein
MINRKTRIKNDVLVEDIHFVHVQNVRIRDINSFKTRNQCNGILFAIHDDLENKCSFRTDVKKDKLIELDLFLKKIDSVHYENS